MTRKQSQGESGAWVADGTGVQPGGDVGVDYQVGESYSVRYQRADRPYAMITRIAYPAKVIGQSGVFFVQIQTEWLVCSDPLNPGDTEIWSESATDDEPGIYDTAKEAEIAAQLTATELLGDDSLQNWDGLPPE